MDNLKDLYKKNINIMKFFRENSLEKDGNSMDAVLCAYDYQAGSYTENYYSDKVVKGVYLKDGDDIELTPGEYTRLAAKCLADVMKGLSFQTMLEVGIGEATTICDVVKNFSDNKDVWGIELSLSRLLFAQKFSKQKEVEINFAVGNMFSLPFPDNSMDLVFTYYCIDAHKGKEKQAIEEMLRVAKKYLILVEPSYELGNEETKKRIDEHCYIKNLLNTLNEMKLNVVEHRLFDIYTKNNNSAITIIKKNANENNMINEPSYSCPKCKKKLISHKGKFFCENCYYIYPIIEEIPVLLEENGILCSKYLEF